MADRSDGSGDAPDHARIWIQRQAQDREELRNDCFALLDSGVSLARLIEMFNRTDEELLRAFDRLRPQKAPQLLPPAAAAATIAQQRFSEVL